MPVLEVMTRTSFVLLADEPNRELVVGAIVLAPPAYWRVIYPGSALIRRMWLRAVRLRAEAPTTSSARDTRRTADPA
jgi:hypothetical protein